MQTDWRMIYSDYAADHWCPTLEDVINHLPDVRQAQRERLAKATGLPIQVFGGQEGVEIIG